MMVADFPSGCLRYGDFGKIVFETKALIGAQLLPFIGKYLSIIDKLVILR